MPVELTWSDRGELRVLSVRPVAGADVFGDWVGDGLPRVLGELRSLLCSGDARVAVVVDVPGDGEPAADALVEGVRGIAEALTRELRERARVNVVVARPGSAVDPALDYLGGEGGGFMAGATLRLP
jgi:hypothetical protein